MDRQAEVGMSRIGRLRARKAVGASGVLAILVGTLLLWPAIAAPAWVVVSDTLDDARQQLDQVPEAAISTVVVARAEPTSAGLEGPLAGRLIVVEGELHESELEMLQDLAVELFVGDEVRVVQRPGLPAPVLGPDWCDLLPPVDQPADVCPRPATPDSVALSADQAAAQGLVHGVVSSSMARTDPEGLVDELSAGVPQRWTGPPNWWTTRRQIGAALTGTGSIVLLGCVATSRFYARRQPRADASASRARKSTATLLNVGADRTLDRASLAVKAEPPGSTLSTASNGSPSALTATVVPPTRADSASTSGPLRAVPGYGLATVAADGGQVGSCTFRGASVRGDLHRRGGVRQDSMAVSTTYDGQLVIAVADGVSQSAHSEVGSDRAVTAAIAALREAPEQLKDALAAANDAILSLAVRDGRVPRELATTLTVATITPGGGHGPPTAKVAAAGVGDSPVALLQAGRWSRTSDSNADGTTSALPLHLDRGWQLSFTVHADQVLVVATDGVGDLLSTPEHRDRLAAKWATPPTVTQFIADVAQFDPRPGLGDDRTAVAVWLTDTDPEGEY